MKRLLGLASLSEGRGPTLEVDCAWAPSAAAGPVVEACQSGHCEMPGQ